MKKSLLHITIVYDNNHYNRNLQPDWGFSCLIKGLDKTILFDTGKNEKILLSNMAKLGICPEDIDVVFLSHFHKDHTGNLKTLLNLNSEIEVWLPEFFPNDFKESAKKKGARLVEVKSSQQICKGAFTTGVIQGWIKEQSLILDTDKGLVLVTGCAHPRIIHIISEVKNMFKREIFLALGGFHLAGFEEKDIREIIEKFKAYGVKKVGPCHCSGDEARKIFYEEYKDDFIEIGVGKEVLI